MTLLYPNFLYLLILLPIVLGWQIYRRHSGFASLRFSGGSFLPYHGGWRVHLINVPIGLRLAALALLIIALARPQREGSWEEQETEGIDIMLTMDISTSMLAMDFSPNRLEAAKRVATSFVSGREHDNIGLVVFAGESFTAAPLTTNHATIINRLTDMTPGIIEDQTAIGLGLITAINRLRESQTNSKVIILLTDGVNNTGDVSPLLAAQMAANYGITIHTIGMGSLSGAAPIPILSNGFARQQMVEVDIDEKAMQEIARLTGGLYYRASDDRSLENIYKEIDQLETTKLRTRSYHVIGEYYGLFVLWAVILTAIEYILRHTLLRINP